MSMLKDDVRFPNCDILAIYLKCGKYEKLRKIFHHLLHLFYTEGLEVVWPIENDEPTNLHFTYSVNILPAESFYGNFASGEVYPWHVNPIAIQVPYGNIFIWDHVSTDWRGWLARTMRCIWHAARLLPNDEPFNRKWVNLAIPWVLLDHDPAKMTDAELYDYAEIVLSSVCSQIWVRNKRVIVNQSHALTCR